MNTAIFYASSTGNTAEVAQLISKELGDIDIIDIATHGVEKINEYSKVIIGTPTWGDGELQDDFDESWDQFTSIDFSGKTVALFGLGDQDGYGEYYADAMGIIYEKVIENGANVVGSVEVTDEYYFEESKAVKDGSFVGLALDEDNQSELTKERITTWCNQIKGEIL